jgi:KOW motif
MKLGSQVIVTSGTHEGLEGKIVALVDSRARDQKRVIGDIPEDKSEEIDPEAYVSVELKINGSIVNVKRKRLILKSQKDLLTSNKSDSNKP